MLLFTVRRLINSVLVLLASSFIVYHVRREPVRPAREVPPAGGRQATRRSSTAQAHLFGLDRPLLTRYWDWLSHLIRFDGSFPFISFNFGKDVYNAPVSTDLAGRMEVTMRDGDRRDHPGADPRDRRRRRLRRPQGQADRS